MDISKGKKLSIITINYNNRDGLRKTLESVARQTVRDFEYIIIDGGSTDGSVDVIKEFGPVVDYWVSEPDKGIYNAMNKGVLAAHGEYCQFLNSGDWLYDDKVVERFGAYSEDCDIILGRLMYVNGDKVSMASHPTDAISFLRFYKKSISHPTSFIRRRLLIDNPYDESYRICSDWKFFIQTIIMQNCTFHAVDDIVAYFDVSGISSSMPERVWRERTQILNEFVPPRILSDYDKIDEDTLELSEMLIPYQGFKKFIFRLTKGLLKVYTLFK